MRLSENWLIGILTGAQRRGTAHISSKSRGPSNFGGCGEGTPSFRTGPYCFHRPYAPLRDGLRQGRRLGPHPSPCLRDPRRGAGTTEYSRARYTRNLFGREAPRCSLAFIEGRLIKPGLGSPKMPLRSLFQCPLGRRPVCAEGSFLQPGSKKGANLTFQGGPKSHPVRLLCCERHYFRPSQGDPKSYPLKT